MQGLEGHTGGVMSPNVEPLAGRPPSGSKAIPAGALVIDLEDSADEPATLSVVEEGIGQNMETENMETGNMETELAVGEKQTSNGESFPEQERTSGGENASAQRQTSGGRNDPVQRRTSGGEYFEPPAKRRKGLGPSRPAPRKVRPLLENLPSRKDWKKRQVNGVSVGLVTPRTECERAPLRVSSEGSPSPATSAALDTGARGGLGRGVGQRQVSMQSGGPRVSRLDVIPPMRASVNVSAFYNTLDRVLTEYTDNGLAAILRLLAADETLLQCNIAVIYEQAVLSIKDDGPGMTLEEFKRAIKLSGTGRELKTENEIRDQVNVRRIPTGRYSMSAASGQYGYGLFAGFSVADEIIIKTKAKHGPTLTCHLKKEDWDSMDTSWQVPYDESGFPDDTHGTEVTLHLTAQYQYTKPLADGLRASLCAVCSPFADVENGLPGTIPPLFRNGKPEDSHVALDKTLHERFRGGRKQPVVVSFNCTANFAEGEERAANLEVALSMATRNPGLVKLPLTPFLEKTAMVCIGLINTDLGRPCIANYTTLYPDMFQVVWQHRGGISGYTPKNLRLLPGRDRLRGVIFLSEYYRPMPPKDKIAADCPLYPLLTKAIDDSLRKNLDGLLTYFRQFDSDVCFEELMKEENGVKFYRKATVTVDGSVTEMKLNCFLRANKDPTIFKLQSLVEFPNGRLAARICLLTCRDVMKEEDEISIEELLELRVKRRSDVDAYRKTLPSEATCEVEGKPPGPRGLVRLRLALLSPDPNKIHLPINISAQILCNGEKIEDVVFENDREHLLVPVPNRAGSAQFSLRIPGWDIKTSAQCKKARVEVPPGPAVKPVVKVQPEKAVKSGQELSLRISFEDESGDDVAKLPRGLEVTATVKGQKGAKNRGNPPIVKMAGIKIDKSDRRVAIVTGSLEGPKQNVTLLVDIKWKGEKDDREDRVKVNLKLTSGRPTGLRLQTRGGLEVENGAELTGLVFKLSDGYNDLGYASEVALTSDDITFDRKKVRQGGGVLVSCLDKRGEAIEDGTRLCKATATYKEKGKDGRELSVDFDLRVLPGKVPKELGFETPGVQGLRVSSGGRLFEDAALKAFVVGESGERLPIRSADAFTVRWKIAHKRGAAALQNTPPPLKAAGFTGPDGSTVLFPELMAPVEAGRYDLLLEVDDRLSKPRLQMSTVVATDVIAEPGLPIRVSVHGGPKKDQEFNAERCYLVNTMSVWAVDASGNFCDELALDVPVRMSVTPTTDNLDANPPSLELLPRDPPPLRDPTEKPPISLQTLCLTPLAARLEINGRVKLHQDGSTGCFEFRIEAEGLEPYVTPFYYTNDSELAEAAEEELALREKILGTKAVVEPIKDEIRKLQAQETERVQRMQELTALIRVGAQEVETAQIALSQYDHRVVSNFAPVLPPDGLPNTDAIESVRASLEERIFQTQQTLQSAYLGENGNSPQASLVGRVRGLAGRLRTSGVLGVLGDLALAEDLRVCRVLASLVLGSKKLCWLVVENQAAKRAAVDFARAHNQRYDDIPFVPLDGCPRPYDVGLNPRFDGCLGYATNLVQLPGNLPENLKNGLTLAVKNACGSAVVFETGEAALKYKKFLLGRNARIPFMVSLDGCRLESNGVEFEGSPGGQRMEFSLAQCETPQLEGMHNARKALLELKEYHERYARALAAQAARNAPGGEVDQIRAEIAVLEDGREALRETARTLQAKMAGLVREQADLNQELKKVQASMKKAPAKPRPTGKTTPTKRGGRR